MPIVFVVARDWTLRATVRAELRERGIDALGIESPEDVNRAVAGGQMPAVIVLEATTENAADPAIRKLIERVPAVLIASRMETVSLPPVASVLYRPVRIHEIVTRVTELIEKGHTA
jgi:hypothetical protein